MKKVKKILLLLYIIDIILALVITILGTSRNQQGMIEVFGYIPITVQSDTLKPEISKNDLILVKKEKNYQQGDLISYITKENTHSVIKTEKIKNILMLNNEKPVYSMSGVNIDNSCIVGKHSKTIPYIGATLNFLLSRDGFLVIFVTPLLGVSIYLLFQFVNSILKPQEKSKA